MFKLFLSILIFHFKTLYHGIMDPYLENKKYLFKNLPSNNSMLFLQKKQYVLSNDLSGICPFIVCTSMGSGKST